VLHPRHVPLPQVRCPIHLFCKHALGCFSCLSCDGFLQYHGVEACTCAMLVWIHAVLGWNCQFGLCSGHKKFTFLDQITCCLHGFSKCCAVGLGCMLGTPLDTRQLTSCQDSSAWKASMFCILWDGMRLVFLLSSTRLRLFRASLYALIWLSSLRVMMCL